MSRIPGPSSVGARISGVPSIEASLNAQIQDLVQRNRTLEHTNKKLADEKVFDAERAKRAVHDAKAGWQGEQAAWREGCNRLLSAHQLAHLRLTAKLSQAEAALLKEMEVSRQHEVARLHRDFQITMFRVREAELEARNDELEEMLSGSQREQSHDILALEDQLKARNDELHSLEAEKTAVENELSKLREKYSRLEVVAESNKTKLERATLQFDGSQTTNAELERQNDELKRTNADIKRQLDRWQSLETKGGEELESLRRQRIDLEVQVKALEGRLEKKEAELQKEKGKVTRFKANAREFEAHAEDEGRAAAEAKRQLAIAQEEIERLQLELDAERAGRRGNASKRAPSPTLSEDEVANDFADAPPHSSPAKPPPKKPRSTTTKAGGRSEMAAGPSKAAASDSDIEEVPNRKPRSRATAKDAAASEKPRSRAKARAQTVEAASENDEDAAPPARSKGKAKAKAVEVEVVDDTESDAPQARPRNPARGKRKRDEGAGGAPEVAEKPKNARPRRVASGGRAGSVQPRGTAVVSDEDSDEPARKKKKRTIGLFPAASQPSFNFLPAPDLGGLEIPTDLSPLKKEDRVPARSSSFIGSIGNMMGFRR